MKNFSSILTLFLSISLLTSPAFAKTKTVRFENGSYSASYSGSIKGYNYDKYIFYAQEGQKLNISLNSQHSDVVLYGYDDFLPNENYTLPKTGKYEVRVGLPREQSRKKIVDKYRINIQITN